MTPGGASSIASGNPLLQPLRVPVFRGIWLASLLSNFGLLIQGVASAWTMAHLTEAAGMVALVQTAIMLPTMLLALPAGALSDSFDRRLICIIALTLSLAGATALTVLAIAGLLTPWVLLGACFIVGAGAALYGPSWQASVAEQVPLDTLPAAVALNGISYNLARAFGPAIGGVLVVAVGAVGAFVANALAYVPLLIMLLKWKRNQEPRRLAPESLGRSVLSGLRFIVFSPTHRHYVFRILVFTSLGSVMLSLPPLIARDMLGGGAMLYGVLLGAVGLGAVAGAMAFPYVRARLSAEASARLSALVAGGAILIAAVSRIDVLTAVALFAAGAAWTNALTLFSVSIQLASPRWVSGRALAIYQATAAAGVALGSGLFGRIVDLSGVPIALAAAGGSMVVSASLGLLSRLPDVTTLAPGVTANRAEPELALELTMRSGPIVVEVEYVVPTSNARAFYQAMQEVRRFRQRTGAYGWSIARDIEVSTLWTERFHSPTWIDYMHLAERSVTTDRDALDAARLLTNRDVPIRVRRLLERPAGSVRQTEDSPDRGLDIMGQGGFGTS